MLFGPGTIQDYEFLTKVECSRLSEKVLSLEQHWEARLGPYEFATLGCAAYLDGEADTYTRKNRTLNPLLRDTFEELYERVRLLFGDILDGEVYYDEAYSYPGFHLFRFAGNEICEDDPADRAHFDYQFARVFPDFAKAKSMPLTFTIPLEEPSTGSSLEVWDLRPDTESEQEPKEYARSHPSQTVRYELGRVFVHDGLSLHAMGKVPRGTQGRRITLQGHIFRTERGWLLYW